MTAAHLPYAGTSGWSGTDTSEERARTADTNGTTRNNQARAIKRLSMACAVGLTWKDLASLTGWHHGTASGVLSVLHKDGVVARLTERRSRCKVYVLPEWVMGRDTEAHGRTIVTTSHPCPICGYPSEGEESS